MAKPARIMTLSFGWVMAGVRARRERTMRVVMAGWRRAWWRTSVPMKPVAPVRMTFIFGTSVVGFVSSVDAWEYIYWSRLCDFLRR